MAKLEAAPFTARINQPAFLQMSLRYDSKERRQPPDEQVANLRLAQQLLDIVAWRMDVETGRLVWCEHAHNVLGVAPKELPADLGAYLDLVHPDDRGGVARNFLIFPGSNASLLKFEHRIQRKNGSIIHVRVVAERAEKEGLSWLTGVVQDVTAEVTSREELAKSHRMQQIAERMARLGGWHVDLDPVRITWSPETCAIHGDPTGTPPDLDAAIEYYAPEHRDRVRAAFTRCAEAGRPFDEVALIVSAKCAHVWVRIIGEPVRDDTGAITAMHGALQDISEMVAMQDQSEPLARRLLQTLENISDAFFLLDHEWRFSFLNGKALELLRCGREELMGQVKWDAFPEAVGSTMQNQFETAMRTGQTVRFQEYFAPLESWFDVHAYPTPEGLAVYLRDVTQQRERENHTESRLRQAQKLEAVGQLTGGIAHDFNNMLTIILGNAEILGDDLGDRPESKKLADSIAAAGDRAADLTNRLLAFSCKQPLQPQLIDLAARIGEIEHLVRRTLPENIDLEIGCTPGLWAAEIDPSQLESAVLNLVLKARDAMPDGGRLTIETANVTVDDAVPPREPDLAAAQYVRVMVTDTGAGIPPDALAHVFEPFFTTKEVGAGSGLGLSMVYGFVKQSGGHVNVRSKPGKGSTFTLYFPRAKGECTHIRPVPSSGRQAVGGEEAILVVEDHMPVREHLIAQLEGLGYRVVGAASGPEAMRILNGMSDIDMLFTDIVMPGGMNGRELADAACALHPHMKVLFTSGYADNALVHRGRLDPDVELLSKPYRREHLAEKVRKVLDHR